ncbi:hypothetical protein FNV43_RR15485 [Rhamnella rubrinervis]|uniref:Uncharacterized protein n=1 Tax=Rhamnella rubrinervis TaxID=2594499 RepID=A0A8K0E7F9_9ROSA|nr:hypothetical protein FNV43_RR15485 [Rhamnella rubrinervis]
MHNSIGDLRSSNLGLRFALAPRFIRWFVSRWGWLKVNTDDAGWLSGGCCGGYRSRASLKIHSGFSHLEGNRGGCSFNSSLRTHGGGSYLKLVVLPKEPQELHEITMTMSSDSFIEEDPEEDLEEDPEEDLEE